MSHNERNRNQLLLHVCSVAEASTKSEEEKAKQQASAMKTALASEQAEILLLGHRMLWKEVCNVRGMMRLETLQGCFKWPLSL